MGGGGGEHSGENVAYDDMFHASFPPKKSQTIHFIHSGISLSKLMFREEAQPSGRINPAIVVIIPQAGHGETD